MVNKTDNYKIVARRLHKTLTWSLYISLPFAYRWLPIFSNIRIGQTAPFKTGTAHRKFWGKDD